LSYGIICELSRKYTHTRQEELSFKYQSHEIDFENLKNKPVRSLCSLKVLHFLG
jgi:hypothetical protein